MITNRHLLLPYVAPYLVYVGLATLLGEVLSKEINYLLRLVCCGGLLVWAWRWYCPLKGPHHPAGSILLGVAAGLIGLVLWLLLLTPFVDPVRAESWTWHGFSLRLLSAGLLVPVFEEILMRGYFFRLALQWNLARKAGEPASLHYALDHASVNSVAPGAWSWAAILLSTLAFTAGHAPEEWLASIAYGILMAALWILRKDLLICISAHATTNIALACYVLASDSWQYW